MRNIGLVGTLVLAGTLCACTGTPPPDGAVASSDAATSKDVVEKTATADELRQLASEAMQAQRLFVPARSNALEYYLALRRREPADASAQSALVDLQPELVIATEQAIANARYPEAVRLLGLLQQVDAKAPALTRLQASVAGAQAAARERALAVDAEAMAKATQAESDLRQVAEQNAAKLAAERTAGRAGSVVEVAQPAAVQRAPAPVGPVASAPTPSLAQPARAVVAQAEQPPPKVPAQTVATAPVQASRNSVPRPIRQSPPRYPDATARGAQSGQVQVAYTIRSNGEVDAPRVVTSDLPNAFERAALAAVSRWKFEATGADYPTTTTVRFDPPGR